MKTLQYSLIGVIKRCFFALLAMVCMPLVIFLPGRRGPSLAHVFGHSGVVIFISIFIAAVFIHIVKMFVTLNSEDGVALRLNTTGIDFRSTWTSRTFRWEEIKQVSLERRSNRNISYFVVSIRLWTGWRKCFDIQTSMLNGSLDSFGVWAGNAEAQLIAHGGKWVCPPTGWFLSRVYNWNQDKIAKARAKSLD